MPEAVNVITLGGRDYPVQPLSVRQLRVVVPAVTGLLRELGPMVVAAERLKLGSEGLTPDMFEAMMSSLQLTEAQFDFLITAIHGTLVRTHPNMTKDDFLNLDATMMELFSALPMVMNMTGLLRSKEGAPGEASPSVEGPAAVTPSTH